MGRVLRSAAIVGVVTGLSGLALVTLTSWWIDRRAKGRCFDRGPSLPRRRTAIVLGARIHRGGRPSTALEDRLAAALELWQAHRVEEVLVSGDGHAPEGDEAEAMRRWLVARGVPAEHIRTDPQGRRTIATMRRAAQVFDVDDAIVCTQAFHLPRALFLAHRYGIEAIGLRADRRYRTRAGNRARELGAKAAAFVEGYLLPPR